MKNSVFLLSAVACFDIINLISLNLQTVFLMECFFSLWRPGGFVQIFCSKSPFFLNVNL